MNHPTTQIATAIALLCLSMSATAQQTDSKAVTPAAPAAQAPAPAKPAKPAEAPVTAAPAASAGDIAKVEVKGASDYDARREDTASKTVITQEEILKYGDSNVYDVLKRAPGVTVVGGALRMRGLGNGYTQVLVNGERPPPGFSMDAVTPEQIERIEIVRAASAEFSMQAIAGTINIVLKKVVSKPQRDLRVNVNHSGENDNVSLFGTIADRTGNLSYYLNGFMNHNESKNPSISSEQFTAPTGQVTLLRDTLSVNQSHSTSLAVNPRLSWKLANEDQLNVNGFVQASRNDGRYDSANTNRIGTFPAPDYVFRTSDSNTPVVFYGGEVNWVAKLAGGKLDAKVAASKGSVDTSSRWLSSTANHASTFVRDIDSDSHYTNFSTTGKYARSMFEGHALATGWEGNYQKTEEDRSRVEGIIGTPLLTIPEQFTPEVTRLAAFIQDEWNVTKQWSIYQGVRYETIRTESVGTGLRTTQSRSHVLSPVAQTLYKFPDKSGRQLRLALTRTYKAPNTNQLSARRNIADLNTRFTPDNSGNPNLQPELATGLDLTYEHFWAPGAVFSVGTSARHITNYIRNRLGQDANGYWLNQPVNDGSAQVRTLDVELKFPLKTVWKDALPLDLRASVNRNWSQVASVPGPDNRLDQQVPLSSVLGVDYKEDKYSAGANFSFRSGGPVRISEQQSTRLQPRRDLEAYVLYKIKTGLQLRVAVNNLLAQENLSSSRYQDVNGANESWNRNPNSRRWQANLEMKF